MLICIFMCIMRYTLSVGTVGLGGLLLQGMLNAAELYALVTVVAT